MAYIGLYQSYVISEKQFVYWIMNCHPNSTLRQNKLVVGKIISRSWRRYHGRGSERFWSPRIRPRICT